MRGEEGRNEMDWVGGREGGRRKGIEGKEGWRRDGGRKIGREGGRGTEVGERATEGKNTHRNKSSGKGSNREQGGKETQGQLRMKVNVHTEKT